MAGGRRVLVLASEPSVNLAEVVRRASRDRAELLVLSLGSSPTPAQRELADQALDLAFELRIPVEARLVTTVEEAKALAENAREVLVAASGLERRNLEAALRPKHPALRGVARWEQSRSRSGLDFERQRTERPESEEVGSESVEALAGRRVAYPAVKTFWSPELAHERKKGALRVYLGAAPGVGKTFAMLGEAQRRKSRGTDVVVGFVETYGRPLTTEMLTGLEVIPRRPFLYRETWFEELDPDAVIDRRPQVALIDELAHTNIPGSLRAKRWEDVLDVLAQGIEVITTVNVQHLESLNDVIANTTGIRQQETVPDWVVDLADQVELVDMSPEALRRRMLHGNVYPDPGKAELALRRFFTLENLTALRELALMRVANRVDAELLERWSKGLAPETRERILVCISRSDLSEDLVRRGARMAQRLHGDLHVLHVRTAEDTLELGALARLDKLTRDLGGEFHIVDADAVVEGILAYAYGHHVTQCVVGESLRPAWQDWFRGSVVSRLIREASQIDIHVIARRGR